MKMMLKEDEYEDLREFVIEANKASLTNLWNSMFTDKHTASFHPKRVNDDGECYVVVEVDKKAFKNLLKVLHKNSEKISSLNDVSIFNILEYAAVFKELAKEIKK